MTYDLAIAMKAYCIQALQAPRFDNVIILLGNFHLEMAFFGAIGTYICDSGIEYLLTEAGILAPGSLAGFIKGKFYNRCCRVHQIIASVMERVLFLKYKETLTDDENSLLNEVTSDSFTDEEILERLNDMPLLQEIMEKYDAFFRRVMEQEYSSTAAYWGIYVYLINRVYWNLQRAVRTNNVRGYIEILPCVIEVFFALNRPNYARWGSLYLQKLQSMNIKAYNLLNAGAFSVRRSTKSYSRCAIDLTLEQTVNRDAASPMKGITAFRNSDRAFRRWSITLTQHGMALSELQQLVGLREGEDPATQLHPWRIKRDNSDIDSLYNFLQGTCNLLDKVLQNDLVNVASGKVAKEETKQFLLSVLGRGADLRYKFAKECETDSVRFLKPVSRTKILNFAAENAKRHRPSSADQKSKAAEEVRDVFGKILAVAGHSNSAINLQHILSFPITDLPLSLAHSDGTCNKTEKAALTKTLERRQTHIFTDQNLPPIKASLIDGECIMHESIMRHCKSTYQTIARNLLIKVCSKPGEQIHLLLDKYQSPSIKDAERKLRGADENLSAFVITGPEQSQRRAGAELLRSSAFKENFSSFIMKEWQNSQYGSIIGRKKVHVSHGGKCIIYQSINGEHVDVQAPSEFQAKHEEADTLIAFHARKLATRTIHFTLENLQQEPYWSDLPTQMYW